MQVRTKLVSFRLSQEEYEHLCAVSAARGARSVSEFLRTSVGCIIENCDRRVWELLSWRQGTSRPITDFHHAEELAARSEAMTTTSGHGLEPHDASAETIRAIETLSGKIDALSRSIWNRLGTAGGTNSDRTS